MTKYGGSWAKGFASTFDPLGGINLGLQWKERKEAKKKIDDALEKLKLDSLTLAAKYDSARVDGSISQQEYSDALAWALPLGDEIMGRVEYLYGNYRQFTKEGVDKELGEIDSFYNLSADLDFTNIEEMKSFGSNLTQERAITKWGLIIKSIEGRGKPVQPEVFPSLEAARAKYPGAKIEFNTQAGGYVVGAGEVKPPAPAELSAKDNWAIDNYKAGRISFNQLSKYMGTYIAPEEMSAKEKEIELAKQYGATNEEIKNKLLGVGVGEPTPPTAPAIENVREDIKNADTLEDARRIEKNHIAKYGDTLDIPDIDKFWAEGQIPYLNKIKTSIGNLIDEKGWLKKGTLTSAEVGVDFEGDQKVEEIYEMLRKEYMKYFDMLTKMGLPLLEFPILKPLEEIEKVGLGEGFWGWGKQRGQYKSIYK